jgi:hypothetical protein
MSIPVSTLTGSNTINQMMYNVNTIKDLAANSAGFVANTVFQSALANTNSYIATKVNTSTFNSALANTNSYIATVSATERAALANTNAYIASVASSSITGPGSSTDNAVVRFDGTSGSTAQNSGVTIADDNSMIISGSSSGDMLRITQTGAGNALVVEDSTNPDSTPFVIDSSGNVGIGRTPTTNLLEVAGTIESTSGGFKFPDGSTQTSAASAGITTGKAIAMAIVFG